jgi:hypothetical protein
VITFEDLVQARAGHAEKEAKKAARAAGEATTGKKRDRPRKSTTVDKLEPKAKVAGISETQNVEGKAGPLAPRAKVVQRSKLRAEAGPSKPKVVQRSEAQIAEAEAGSSKPEAVAHTTPHVEIVSKLWRAPEARMY